MLIHYKLDDDIEVDGETYTVNAAFDVILRCNDLIQDSNVSDLVKPSIALDMLVGERFEYYTIQERIELVTAILGLYIEFEEDVQLDLAGNPMPKQQTESKRLFSFMQDSDSIYAAFMQVYNIDLIDEQGKLHWRKFKALLNNLPSGNAFSRIMEIRGWTPADDKKKRSVAMRELQEKIRLREE